MKYEWVTDQTALDQLMQQYAKAPALFLDTEFVHYKNLSCTTGADTSL